LLEREKEINVEGLYRSVEEKDLQLSIAAEEKEAILRQKRQL
jgi:hypothetical protein